MKKLDKAVYTALNKLNEKGYEAYLVGGAVRDFLLNIDNSDYDITTNSSPESTRMIFSEYTCYDVGKKHGTITVLIDRKKIDITPFRTESHYVDHRHPKKISFSNDLREDLKRRDFTINAMCMDMHGKIIDFHHGMQDLQDHIIRTVGNPKTRFSEDALRILRAIRFKAQLDFSIEQKTDKQLHQCKELLEYISPERKKEELLHLLKYRNAFTIINEYLDVFNTFMPFRYIKRRYNNFTDPLFSLAYLLKDLKDVKLKHLKYSNSEIDLIRTLIASTRIKINDDHQFITVLSNPFQKETLLFLNLYHRKNFDERFRKLKKYIVDVNDLHIDGTRIKQYGYSSKQIGLVKKHLVEMIRHKKLTNSTEVLEEYLKKHNLFS